MAGPTCPRCDYDLSGLVATWTSACPMQATCSECGLVFDCPNVLSPRHIGPLWSFEHGPRATAGRFLRTSWTATRPWRLCTDLRIDHAVRPARLIWFILLWLGSAHLTLAVGRAWLANLSGFWSFPGTIRMGRGLAALMDGGFWEEFASVLAFPYGGLIAIPQGAGSVSVFPLYPVFLLIYVPTLLTPLWMLILRAILASARVRRLDLLRGLAYSLPVGMALAITISALLVGTLWLRGTGPAGAAWDMVRYMAIAGLLGFPVYHGLWWWCFIRRYLKLRHALLTVILMEFMSGLVIVIVGSLAVWLTGPL